MDRVKIPVRGPFGMGVAAAILGAALTSALVTGRIRLGKHSSANSFILERTDNPLGYWLVVCLLTVITLAIVIQFIRAVRDRRMK